MSDNSKAAQLTDEELAALEPEHYVNVVDPEDDSVEVSQNQSPVADFDDEEA